MTNCFSQGVTPNHWKAEYSTPPMTVDQWIQDLGKRCRVLHDYQPVLENSQAMKHVKFWFGVMFNPEAFIPATRQSVDQKRVVMGKSVSVRVDQGRERKLKKNKNQK